MIVGNPETLAIESGITEAYARLSMRGRGYFVIHVGGYRFGLHSADATMLACSFDEVGQRIGRRGEHSVPFASEPDAGMIAGAVREALYGSGPDSLTFFGLAKPILSDLIYDKHLLWAPDGDAAFDDGSYVLQFDLGDRVRLIAFKADDSYGYESSTLRDVWLDADAFYATLQQWHATFEAEWVAAPKVVESTV